MSALSSKSSDEIIALLDEYGIKHGPVVASTRGLYEKKLIEAMAKRKTSKQSPDKTYYREEEEEVTYVYRTPTRTDGSAASGTYKRSQPHWPERDEYEPHMYDTPSAYSGTYPKSTPTKPGRDAPPAPKSSGLIPLWLKFLVFLALAVFLYIVYSNMETNESMKGIE